MVEPQSSNAAFPAIPTEITLIILEALVDLAPEKAVELATLSRDLQPFIERLLYRSIILPSRWHVISFVELVRSNSRPLSFYHDRIRNVCVLPAAFVSFTDAIILLSVCCNTDILAFRTLGPATDSNMVAQFHSSLSTLRLKRLSVWLDDSKTMSPSGPDRFQDLTHLQILVVGLWNSSQYFNDRVLQHLPQLTHLCYMDRFPGSSASSFASSLQLSSKIAVCLVWVFVSPGPSLWFMDHDARIVLLFNYKNPWNLDSTAEPVPEYVLARDIWNPSIFLHDWGRKQSSEPDMWELAEEKVELQRRLQKSSLVR
ncbi:hypothetical protein C8J56DRAFT_1039523 [Mycena floridula]|nr:hypothetical protein C8J56DRAFT_1039523 [Mycena floridula]